MKRTRHTAHLLLLSLLVGACGTTDSGFEDDCDQTVELALGQPYQAVLNAQDCRREADDTAFDQYRFVLDEELSIQIDMMSVQFNSFLWLYDDDGDLIESDDNDGNANNARITRVLRAGTYMIHANTHESMGAYTLLVRPSIP